MDYSTSAGPLNVNGWHEPTAKLRRLQRLQIVILAVVCVCSAVVVAVSIHQSMQTDNRQRVAGQHLERLLESRDHMITLEVQLWRNGAGNVRTPIADFLSEYANFRRTVFELGEQKAGGTTRDAELARQHVMDSIRQVDRITSPFAGQDNVVVDNITDALLRATVPAEALRQGMNEWIAAATAVRNEASAASRRESRELRWIIVGVIVLLFLSGAALWLLVDRARARLIRALESSEERFRSLVTNSSDAVLVVDREGLILYASVVSERLFGVPSAQLVGTPIVDLVAPSDTSRMRDFGLRGGDIFEHGAPVIWSLRHSDGSLHYIESVGVDRTADDAVGGIVINSRDVTDRREMERTLAHRAFHDTLTDLANRALFENRVDHALTAIPRLESMVAVLLIDLDDFKTINDSLGHQAGDMMIVEIANRLRSALRASDTAARLGGDEFAVLVESCYGTDEITGLVRRLVRLISEPMMVEGRELVVQSSIGIAIASSPGHTVTSMMRDADVAMYAAKARGGAGWAMYEPSMNERASERLGLITDLHRAIEKDEFFLAYQPIVTLATGHVSGMEALLRWRHPERGLVSPLDFIGLAEETGQIREIGTWVLNTGLRQMARWTREIPEIERVRLAINVSIRQFEDPAFAMIVANALEQYSVDGRHLTLEITEHALARDHEAVRTQMSRLKRLGVTLAIDDFGTGYSSLAYLANLPIDIVKIDRGFVDGLRHGHRDMRIAEMIVRIGESLQLMTVAEGVEDGVQEEVLRELGCSSAQGFHYCRPTTADAMTAILRHGFQGQPTAAEQDMSSRTA